jgi:hypothetical protein
MYTALVLDEKSQTFLQGAAMGLLPEGWVTRSRQEPGLCHHMTICMGQPKAELDIRVGQPATVVVNSVAKDDKVMAVGCEAFYEDGQPVPSTNQRKHVTLAIKYSEDGTRRVGKPFQSNMLTNWEPRDEIKLTGTVQVLE